MSLTVNERAARYRAKKRGEEVAELKRGPKCGYKQTKDHVEKRKRFGTEHHAWIGDSVSTKSGRSRANRKFALLGNPKSRQFTIAQKLRHHMQCLCDKFMRIRLNRDTKNHDEFNKST